MKAGYGDQIREMLAEAENERMHLMFFIEIAKVVRIAEISFGIQFVSLCSIARHDHDVVHLERCGRSQSFGRNDLCGLELHDILVFSGMGGRFCILCPLSQGRNTGRVFSRFGRRLALRGSSGGQNRGFSKPRVLVGCE